MNLQRFDTLQADAIRFANRDSSVNPIVAPFRFAGPGIRTRLTLKVIVRQEKPSGQTVPFDWTVTGLLQWFLWIARVSTDKATGLRVPVANILGTRAAPVQLDEGAAALVSVNGVSIDHETGADGIDGELTLAAQVSSPAFPLVASIRGRYNAVGALCDSEWAAVRARCGDPALALGLQTVLH